VQSAVRRALDHLRTPFSRTLFAAFTLTIYRHLFPSDLDLLAARIDAVLVGQSGEVSRPIRGLP